MSETVANSSTPLTIYAKLAQARTALTGLSKGGSTKAGGSKERTYFELGDFLPKVALINAKIGLLPVITMTEDLVTMTIYNTEEPGDSVAFTSPMSSANMSGCQPVQSLGAVHTYMRRYMYMLAYDIVESDQLEPRTGEVKDAGQSAYIPKSQAPEWKPYAESLQLKAQRKYGQKAREAYKDMLDFLGISSSQDLTATMAKAGEEMLERWDELIAGDHTP